MATKLKSKIRSKPKNKAQDNSVYDHEGNILWIVEEIVEHKLKGGKDFYLIKWLGWSEKENTWEPEENLAYVKEMVQDFKRQNLTLTAKENEVNFTKNDSDYDCSLKTAQETGAQFSDVKKGSLSKYSKKIRRESMKISSKNPQPYVLWDDAEVQEESQITVKDYGMFEFDKVEMIEEHAVYAGEVDNLLDLNPMVRISDLMFKVKWMERSNRTRPLPTWYSINDVKLNCADKLANYYEKFLKFSD